MGYACPVCDAPQRDADHLANHLAITAVVHGEDHEAWLDEHAPGWADAGAAELGERVTPLAEPAQYDEVFEDTVHGHVGGENHDHGRPSVDSARASPVPDDDDEVTRAALAEAREMTRRMLGDGDAGDDATAGTGTEPGDRDDGTAATGDGGDGKA
jgi:hypothetical protein